MFFSAFRVEGIWKRAAAVCDARHLLAELWKRVRRRKSAVAMNAGEISNEPMVKRRRAFMCWRRCSVTHSARRMTVAAHSVCYPPASTSVCPVTDRPKGNDRVYEAGGISVRRTRAMQRRRICAAKRSAAIQIADL